MGDVCERYFPLSGTLLSYIHMWSSVQCVFLVKAMMWQCCFEALEEFNVYRHPHNELFIFEYGVC